MKENRKLLKEVLKDIRRDMTDEEVLNLLADSKISVSPESGTEKYTLGQRAADAIAKFAGSRAFIFSFSGVPILWIRGYFNEGIMSEKSGLCNFEKRSVGYNGGLCCSCF